MYITYKKFRIDIVSWPKWWCCSCTQIILMNALVWSWKWTLGWAKQSWLSHATNWWTLKLQVVYELIYIWLYWFCNVINRNDWILKLKKSFIIMTLWLFALKSGYSKLSYREKFPSTLHQDGDKINMYDIQYK